MAASAPWMQTERTAQFRWMALPRRLVVSPAGDSDCSPYAAHFPVYAFTPMPLLRVRTISRSYRPGALAGVRLRTRSDGSQERCPAGVARLCRAILCPQSRAVGTPAVTAGRPLGRACPDRATVSGGSYQHERERQRWVHLAPYRRSPSHPTRLSAGEQRRARECAWTTTARLSHLSRA